MNKCTEKTLIILKGDTIQRCLMGEIIGRFERIGLKLVACKFLIPEKKLINSHYLCDKDFCQKVGEKALKKFAEKNMKLPKEGMTAKEYGEHTLQLIGNYFTSGPIMPMIWEGPHAVQLVRKLIGSTEPLSSDVGTIRGDYVLDSFEMADEQMRSIFNLVHASSCNEDAEKEIAVWFNDSEIVDYKTLTEKVTYKGGTESSWY